MSYYRRIYIKKHGFIPKDENGRSYDIHHIDGNRKNNDIDNLIALSIQKHYDTHLKQNDYGACLALAKRIKMDPKHITELSSKTNKGKIRSEETKQKISLKNKGRIQSLEEKQYRSKISKGKKKGPMSNFQKSQISKSKLKPVYCIELDLTFNSLCETGNYLNLNTRSISNQINGLSKFVRHNKQKLTFKYL